MVSAEKAQHINQVLNHYFAKNKVTAPVLAKHFMNEFIKAGIFPVDSDEGFPIRELLRELDRTKQLHLIPFVIPVRKNKNTNWFFAPADVQLNDIVKQKTIQAPTKSRRSGSKSRLDSDECYVLDLCDAVLHLNSARQHTFPFLAGDPGSRGICRKLPLDGWYEQLNLVIEYNEQQHSKTVSFFDKRVTVSGVTRGEQRKKYDQRRLEVLKKHGINVVVFSYSDFGHDSRKRLLRNPINDIVVIRGKLKRHVTKNSRSQMS